MLPAEVVRMMLRDAPRRCPNPLGVCSRPEYRDKPGARVVLLAGQPWHPGNASLFPASSRAAVPFLLWLKKQLASVHNVEEEALSLVIAYVRRSCLSDGGARLRPRPRPDNP